MEAESYQDTRRKWHEANAEGRYATADYLAAHLPPSQHERVPEGERDRFALAGEIGAAK